MTYDGALHLEDVLGAEWAAQNARVAYGHEPHLTPRTVYGPDGGRTILAALQRLLERSHVELRLRPRVTQLLPGRRVIVDSESGSACGSGMLVRPARVLGRELGQRLGRAA